MFKNLLFGIGLLGLAVASAKSYHITLTEAYTVGTTQLKAGDYRLVVNGSTAALEDAQAGRMSEGCACSGADRVVDYGRSIPATPPPSSRAGSPSHRSRVRWC